MAKLFLRLNLLCGLTTVIACASECTSYVIRSSQSQSCPGDRYNSTAACVDNELTLSQFVNNSSDYLTNDTTLIISPGNYSLESELVVENVYSFSIFAWPATSSKIVITCGHNTRFAFRNVSIVTVSGLEFVGCFENHVLSVGHFQLENSGFFGNGQPLVNGTVLSIEESTASLNRVAYVSVIDKPLTIQQVLEILYPDSYNCTELAQIFSTVDRAIGISLTRSSISITQSWFEGNNVGLIGGVIYDEFGSDITIVNTTFINNSASDLYTTYTCSCSNDCNNFTSGIVYANGHGNTVKIYASKFVQNAGLIIFGDNCNMFITNHSKLINNNIKYTFFAAAVYMTYTNLTISHSTFTNNGAALVETHYGVITSIDHSKFINNTGSWILYATTSAISVTHSEFADNTVTQSLLYLNGEMITLYLNEFINNYIIIDHWALMEIQYYTSGVSINHSEFLFNKSGLRAYDGVIASIDHSKFINNTASILDSGTGVNIMVNHSEFINNTGLRILDTTSTISVTHSEFADNTVTQSLFYLNGDTSTISVTHSEFTDNTVTQSLLYLNGDNSTISVTHSEFADNTVTWPLLYLNGDTSTISVTHSEFADNTVTQSLLYLNGDNSTISVTQSEFADNTVTWPLLYLNGDTSTISVTHSEFADNTVTWPLLYLNGDTSTISVTHSEFADNTVTWPLLYLNGDTSTISVTHSEFADNTVTQSLLYLNGEMITLYLNEFINNYIITDGWAVVHIPYYTSAENLTNNVFSDNSAAYEVLILLNCRQDHGLSLDSSHCIKCPENWFRDLIGIVVAAFIAGIALVIFMLALNMTVAVGTLSGILFYANIVAANADTYFLSLKETNFVNVFISWLNLDIGFDVCFNDSDKVILYKALLQLAFPAYVIILVIIVIVASECSSKFAKIVGKGNPVAVLATLILLSYAKFFNTIFTSFSLWYLQPAHGSRNVDITRVRNVLTQDVGQSNDSGFKAAVYFLLIFSTFILLLCIIFTALVFSWQWLLRYQDKVVFKWVRYQKLRLFLEPYHAPYTAKYRYWTGLLLFVRALLYLISLFNFSLDPRVELITVIFIIGGLILLKGVIAKRVYKSWLLDVMETAIYFNLVAFSALTWYNLDFGGNQVAVAYTSVMIIFTLLLGVIVFHVLRYTKLYKYSFVEKAFKWTSSKLLENKPKEQPLNDPEELDGYRLERSAVDDQELPTITYSVIEINQPAQNQEENHTG